MQRHVIVVFVHGIYGRQIDFAELMKAGVLALLPTKLHNFVIFGSVTWADLVRERQQKFLQDAIAAEDIVDNGLRRFLIYGLGDAAAYQKTRDHDNSIYYLVQGRISDVLASIDAPALNDPPLIFIGHSLGCHIISSYAWDLNLLKQRTSSEITKEGKEVKELWKKLQSASKFRRLDTFAGFVTLGSNMPLFTFTFGPNNVFPITSVRPGSSLKPAFPGVALSPHLFEQARWLNFFSKRDLLGFPLKPLNPAYKHDTRIQDICVVSESRKSRAVPYLSFLSAHSGYWTNPVVLR